jgi:hypothetical protein
MKNNFKARSKFERWVRASGGTLTVSKRLNVVQSTVQHWCAGRVKPSLQSIDKILKLSKGNLSLRDILRGTNRVQQ